jgi:hypothetical protein
MPSPTVCVLSRQRHASYRQELRLAHYVGGPFEDRTGGLITFDADDTALVQRAVYGDPFILEGLVDAHWLKKWTPESKHPTAMARWIGANPPRPDRWTRQAEPSRGPLPCSRGDQPGGLRRRGGHDGQRRETARRPAVETATAGWVVGFLAGIAT